MVGHKSATRDRNLKKGWAIVQNALKVLGNIWDGMQREDKILDAVVFIIIYFCTWQTVLPQYPSLKFQRWVFERNLYLFIKSGRL